MYYVYKFLDAKNNVIYVGRTKDIVKRMEQHFSKGHLPEECYTSVNKVYYTEFNSFTDMAMYEIYLINALKPKYNTTDKDIENEDFISEFGVPEKHWKRYNIGYCSKNDYKAMENVMNRSSDIVEDLYYQNSRLLYYLKHFLCSNELYEYIDKINKNKYFDKYKDEMSMYIKSILRDTYGKGINGCINNTFHSSDRFQRQMISTFEELEKYNEKRYERYLTLLNYNQVRVQNNDKSKDLIEGIYD